MSFEFWDAIAALSSLSGFLLVWPLMLFAGYLGVYIPFRMVRCIISEISGRFGYDPFREFGDAILVKPSAGFSKPATNCLLYEPARNVRLRIVRRLDTQLTITIAQESLFCARFILLPFRLAAMRYLIFGDRKNIKMLRHRSAFNSLIGSLERSGFFLHINRNGIKIWKRLRPEDVRQANFTNWIRLAQDFARLCSGVSRPATHLLEGKSRCAYCKETIHDETLAIRCSVCFTPHHADCLRMNGACSLFGCANSQSNYKLEKLA